MDFIASEGLVTRERVLGRFKWDDPRQVTGILRDLTENGLIFLSGSETGTIYRAATESEIGSLSRLTATAGLDELVWLIVYREGPLTEEALKHRIGDQCDGLTESLDRLLADQRIERSTRRFRPRENRE